VVTLRARGAAEVSVGVERTISRSGEEEALLWVGGPEVRGSAGIADAVGSVRGAAFRSGGSAAVSAAAANRRMRR
jgi:hypothetical protein